MDVESLRYVYLRRVVGTVLGAMGIEGASKIARRLAGGVFELNPPGRRNAEARLRDALGSEIGEAELDRVVRAMYDHVARFWVEVLFIRRFMTESGWRRSVRVTDEASLHSLHDAGRGCLLTTGYFGNPAVGACALGQIFRPVHVVLDLFAQPYLRAWQRELYERRWVRPIDHRDAVHAVPRVLEQGGAVMMVCENPRRRGKAIAAPFLGRTLNCYPTLGRLARWFDVPVGVFTCRRGEGPFSFELALHATIRPGPNCEDDEAIVRRAVAALERAVLSCPEQYLWSVDVDVFGGRPWGPAAGGGVTNTETGSAWSPGTRQKGLAWQKPSAAGRSPAGSAAATAPGPTASGPERPGPRT